MTEAALPAVTPTTGTPETPEEPGTREEPETPGPSEPSRHERRKRATRAAVRDAALRLAVRQGVERTTIEQIAAEADIAVRTFFNHFSGKEEAVVAAAAVGAEAFVAEFRSRPPQESVLRAIREAVLVAMDRHDAVGRDHIRALRLMRGTPSLMPQQMAVLTVQEDALAAAIAERIGPDGGPGPGRLGRAVHARLCAAASLAALRIVLDRWLAGTADSDDPPPLDVLRAEADAALAQLAAGLDHPGRPDGG
ncbi:TetR/AcrR family transcriptional regulator [Pseudonocardia humida]|uniref:TetR family transcriptional regulator n=1 Tax=Pseudonocardia humida TaxID=2800819 RepID=A0ABT1A809_9PSEU|nr:TetR/AcrR family transcriptional regulator [Pseudonocardia humida]MCO1658849.1 TetR family transcriptional regulator [Pseudonocardia humida]